MKTATIPLSILCLAACGAPDPAGYEATGSADLAVVACAQGETTEGIDVSAYQPNTDWTQVKADGRAFAFVKATEGLTYQNAYFAQDWSGMKDAGLIRGAYHFFHPAEDPIAQADHFASVLADNGAQPSDLPPVCDFEASDGISGSAVAASAVTFLERLEQQTGKTPIIYTAAYFWNEIGGPEGFDKYFLWVADWQPDCPEVFGPWSGWPFWQYSDSGDVGGVQTTVDLDRFNGSVAALASFGTKPLPGSIGSASPSPSSSAPISGGVLQTTAEQGSADETSAEGAACAWRPVAGDRGKAALLFALGGLLGRRRRSSRARSSGQN